MVEFEPLTDCFTNDVMVSMRCPDPAAEIRYTLDGSDPDGYSRLYTKPVVLRMTTKVKARAFRKGVTRMPPTVSGDQVSAVQSTVYRKEEPWAPQLLGPRLPGAAYWYYEENPWQLSAFILDALTPVKSGVATELFDISAKRTNGVYAFMYHGYLDITTNGIYSFHAPAEFIYPPVDSGYDLRVFLDGQEWYPATRWHNYGVWSVPLQVGKHSFKVIWVDQRKQDVHGTDYAENRGDYIWDGDKPTLLISGPGLEKQPIPARMLFH
jgi:hypothetical protein